jgi:hypothetical protein
MEPIVKGIFSQGSWPLFFFMKQTHKVPLVHNQKPVRIWLHICRCIWLLWPFRAIGLSTESAVVLWTTAHDLLKRCGPQCRIWLGSVSHWADSGLHYRPQCGISFKLDKKQIPCVSASYQSTCMWPHIYMPVALYPHAWGHVSMCLWPCNHVQVALHPHAEFGYALCAHSHVSMCICCVSVCTRLSIHMIMTISTFTCPCIPVYVA